MQKLGKGRGKAMILKHRIVKNQRLWDGKDYPNRFLKRLFSLLNHGLRGFLTTGFHGWVSSP